MTESKGNKKVRDKLSEKLARIAEERARFEDAVEIARPTNVNEMP
jgi:hypothetical protein